MTAFPLQTENLNRRGRRPAKSRKYEPFVQDPDHDIVQGAEAIAAVINASMKFVYEHQEDSQRTVRVWGDTAVVTAKLWVKGSTEGRPVEYRLWFSDTYVRMPAGWRYVFGQASLPLPKAS